MVRILDTLYGPPLSHLDALDPGIAAIVDSMFADPEPSYETDRDYARRALDEGERFDKRPAPKPVCPWGNLGDGGAGLRPEDPCPVCGDLGTIEANEYPSRCIDP